MIAAGHPDPWSYTPRQIAAYQFIASKRELRSLSDRLTIAALSQTSTKAVKEQLKKWQADLE